MSARSGSMASGDRRPLGSTPVSSSIVRRANNRLGAVFSALYSFWVSRDAATNSGSSSQGLSGRRDSYSVILFNEGALPLLANDFSHSPNQLLDLVLVHQAQGFTNYTAALKTAQEVMVKHWTSERQVAE